MNTIKQLCDFLETFAPVHLAEDWDNVGLLTGDPKEPVQRVMTCLTITPESAAEAIARKAQLIVSHHPLPFRPLSRLTTDMTGPRLIWQLARANVAIYSPHTAFDSASQGINQSLAEKIGLTDIAPLLPIAEESNGSSELGAGRWGTMATPENLLKLSERLKGMFDKPALTMSGDPNQLVGKVAVACGSGGSFLTPASKHGCDVLVTGEATFHTVLEAKAAGVGLILLGHYQSERFAVEQLATQLGQAFPEVEVWASEQESDPIQWV